jgi:hypothetical protein
VIYQDYASLNDLLYFFDEVIAFLPGDKINGITHQQWRYGADSTLKDRRSSTRAID